MDVDVKVGQGVHRQAHKLENQLNVRTEPGKAINGRIKSVRREGRTGVLSTGACRREASQRVKGRMRWTRPLRRL